jgi:hypothetical protein
MTTKIGIILAGALILKAGFGVITLDHDTEYQEITFGPGDKIVTDGYKLIGVPGAWIDFSQASQGSIVTKP